MVGEDPEQIRENLELVQNMLNQKEEELKKVKQKGGDPKLEDEIIYLGNRVDELQKKLGAIEIYASEPEKVEVKQKNPAPEPAESGPKKSKKDELEEKLLERKLAEQDKEAAKWGRAKKVGGGIKKTYNAVFTGGQGNMLALIAFFSTLALAILDYRILPFGGISSEKVIEIFSMGSIGFALMTLVPIWTLMALFIKMLLNISAEYKTIKWVGVTILLLVIANTLTNLYGGVTWKYSVSVFTFVAIVFSMFWGYTLLGEDRRELFRSQVFLFVVISFIISYAVLTDIGTIFHLGIAGLVWIYFRDETGDKAKSNTIVASLLVIDWVGWGVVRTYFLNVFAPDVVLNRYIFPIWFLVVALWSFERKDSKIIKIGTIIVTLIYLVTFAQASWAWYRESAQTQADPQEIEQARSFGQKAIDTLKAFPKQIWEGYQKGMIEATGGYYKGKVEENQDPRNELGVHIDNLEAADKQFYQNEQVVVWGDLKAKTLDKPVYIYMSCESDDAHGEIIPHKLSNPEYLVNPKKGYEIERLEQMPFECRLQGGQLKAGTNNIKIKVEFNFETLGYLKTYFMDIERMRALRRENIDPLRQYGIDKKPKAVFTNGPVKLGMGTVDPPVGLSTTSEGYSYVGVTIQPQWYGKIKSITNVEIQIPKDLDILDPGGASYCRAGFELVEEDREGYSIYKMKEDEIKRVKTPIEAYKSWRCSINIPNEKVPEILGNTPVAVHYYRASVDYIYEIEKSRSVFIKAVPGERRILSDCKTECDDSDGCICNAAGCCIPQGESIEQGYTCDNYPSGSNICRGYQRTIEYIENATEFIDVYLILNELCAQGQTNENEIDAALKAKEFEADDKVLKSIKELAEKCLDEDTKINYIENAEDKIVNKIKNTVTIFQTTRDTLQLTDANKKTLNIKKDDFIKKIDEVIENFKEIKDTYPNLKIDIGDQRLSTLKTEKAKLENLGDY